jgi:NADH oxidase (H2O2-forming)
MKKEVDVLVVGGGPAGMISAITAKRYYPKKNILLIKNVSKGCIPCGIPYMFASLKNPEENSLGNAPLEKNGIAVNIDEAISIDRQQKTVITKKGFSYHYEKLILAVGSSPIMPPIPGIDLPGVYPIFKDIDYLKEVIAKTHAAKNVLVLGGGFIGVEFADELSKIENLNVYLVEALPRLLMTSFDSEFSSLVQEKLESQGVHVLTDTKVEEFLGKDHVEKVILSNGEAIDTENVILGIGSTANSRLASNSRLDLSRTQCIWVDEYMRTVDPDIFAVGDCASKTDFYTRKPSPVMLASTATAEARIAGANLYTLKVVRENKGTISIYSTYINGLVLGSAGLTERSSNNEGFETVIGIAQCSDKHPATLPGTNNIRVKLIFSRKSGIIMGGQVAGGFSCGEMINLIGLAIQQRVSATELETLQVATHPYLTSSPTVYPIVIAAQDASNKM